MMATLLDGYTMTDEPRTAESMPRNPREVASADLLRGDKEVWIRHGGEVYRLRLTRSGKLILQK